MTTTYKELTNEQTEWFDCLWSDIALGSGYWLKSIEFGHFVDNENDTDGQVKIVPDMAAIGDYKWLMPSFYIFGKDFILRAVEKHADWFIDHKRPYFRRAGECMKEGNFAYLDYDADVTDCLLQLALWDDVIFG